MYVLVKMGTRSIAMSFLCLFVLLGLSSCVRGAGYDSQRRSYQAVPSPRQAQKFQSQQQQQQPQMSYQTVSSPRERTQQQQQPQRSYQAVASPRETMQQQQQPQRSYQAVASPRETMQQQQQPQRSYQAVASPRERMQQQPQQMPQRSYQMPSSHESFQQALLQQQQTPRSYQTVQSPRERYQPSNQQQEIPQVPHPPPKPAVHQPNPTLYTVVQSPRRNTQQERRPVQPVESMERPELSWDEMLDETLWSYMFGFPKDTTLDVLFEDKTSMSDVSKKVSTFEMLYLMGNKQCNRGPESQKMQCVWDFVVDMVLRLRAHTHASMSTGLSDDALRVGFIFKYCLEKNGESDICPRPCGNHPCLGRSHVVPSSCRETNNALYREDFRCTCDDQHKWNPLLLQCVN